jgi:sarcosine oxidase, subunit alpha
MDAKEAEMKKNIMICRCEDISLYDIEKAMEEGYTTYEELKRYLRIGMGLCQGRTCTRLMMQLLREKTGMTYDKIKVLTSRPPSIPVPIGVLATPLDDGGKKDA